MTLTCPKAPHDARGGYLHDADDDTPYWIDGVSYCGRCHYVCDPDGRCGRPGEPAPAGQRDIDSAMLELSRGLTALRLEVDDDIVRDLTSRANAVVTAYCDALRDARSRLSSLEAERRWVPVEERMPPAFDPLTGGAPAVLVQRAPTPPESYTVVLIGYCVGGLWHEQGSGKVIEPTHWMSLPTPPAAVPREESKNAD